ncbi:hypothetical protein B4U80_04804, partial [Leptotrombidium deliense]
LSNHNGEVFICRNCLSYSTQSKTLMERHKERCNNNKSSIINFPNEKTLYFKNHIRKLKMPYVIYADFESFLMQLDSCSPSNEKSFTQKYQLHKASSYCVFIKSLYDNIKNPLRIFRRQEIEKHFCEYLTEISKEIYMQMKIEKKIIITEEQEKQFKKSKFCWMCDQKFEFDYGHKQDDRVRDHDHYTGLYRGPAHRKCNVNFHEKKVIPIFFHNLSGYDSHLFIKNLGFDVKELKLIAQNEEKYISFSKNILVEKYEYKDKKGELKEVKKYIELRFLDSLRFMPESINSLSNYLKPDQFHETINYLKKLNLETKIEYLRKGVFPYKYIDSMEKYNETKLPSQESFYNDLSKTHITDEEYNYAQKVWNEFECKTIDIFENFRNVCMKTYDFDPCWYYTTAGLSWDAMLKITKIKLEYINNVEMLLFFESGIRGGISQVSHSYAKANNKYYEKDIKEEKKAKGTKTYVVKKELKFQNYYDILMKKSTVNNKPNVLYKNQNVIRSKKHEIYSQTINKIALSYNDDKRFKLDNGISSLPYGH